MISTYIVSMKSLVLSILLFSISLTNVSIGQDEFTVHVINIGQGSATLLEFPCGAILVDVGGEENDNISGINELEYYLDEFFERRSDLNKTLDLLLFSHPHKDHTRKGAVVKVLSKYSIKNAITNGQERGSGKWGQIYLHDFVMEREGTIETSDDIGFWISEMSEIPRNGVTNEIIDPIDCSGINPKLSILWGYNSTNHDWSSQDYKDQNNHSVVMKVEYNNSSMMFTGDLETSALEDLLEYHDQSVFDTDVYLVGHHGSANGTSVDFTASMSPKIAVISFGDPEMPGGWTAHQYGHPRDTIVKILEQGVSGERVAVSVPVAIGQYTYYNRTIDRAIYGTGWDGSITLSTSGDGAWVVKTENSDDFIEDLIDVNTADRTLLETLPAIGPAKAQAIIDYREINGAFESVDAITNVSGIGEATLLRIRDLVKI
jgi:competence protein ComEC